MSLQFYIGRTGTGKTAQIIEEIQEKLKSDPLGAPQLIIVPDQMSFQIECALLSDKKIPGTLRAQVLSFSRLAWFILGNTEVLTKAGANMLLRRILAENHKKLEVYRQIYGKEGFIAELGSLFTEYKRYQITPEILKEAREKTDSPNLKAKLSDMSYLYEKYCQIVGKQYIDTEEIYQLLAEKISDSNYLKQATIYIDGFHRFTPLEMSIISELLIHCKEVIVALTLNAPYRKKNVDGNDLFRQTGQTYKTIYQLASTNNILVSCDKIFTENKRSLQNSNLAHLEKNFVARPLIPSQHQGEINILTAYSPRLEIEAIAQKIINFARNGYRFCDMAILMRDNGDYGKLIETIFNDYKIPFFLDEKKPMIHHPLIEFILAAFEIINTNWRHEAIFRVLKTDLLLPNDDDYFASVDMLAKVENFVLKRGIYGQTWGKHWTYSRYQSFNDKILVQTDAELFIEKELNEMRLLIFAPLIEFSKAINAAKTISEYVACLHQLLSNCEVGRKLEKLIIKCEQEEKLTKAKHHEQAWHSLLDLMEQLVSLCGNEKVSFDVFKQMLTSGLEELKFSLTPPAIDQVVINNLDIARLQKVKIAFVIGLNEGVLPKRMKDAGLLTENDRISLESSGLKLAPTAITQLYDEEFLAYTTFTLASDQLVCSHPISSLSGAPLLPSSYIKRLTEMFPNHKHFYASHELPLNREEQLSTVVNTNATLKYLIAQLSDYINNGHEIDPIWWDVYNEYCRNSEKKDACAFAISGLFANNRAEKLSSTTTENLYGKNISGSISSIEMFNKCPFSYYLKHGLKLTKRPIYKFLPPDSGTLLHESLSDISDTLVENKLTWAELTYEKCQNLAKSATDKKAQLVQSGVLLSTARLRYLQTKYAEIMTQVSWAMKQQTEKSNVLPYAFELPFGTKDAKIPSLVIPLTKRNNLKLCGRIDRVDIGKNRVTGENFAYIVDYKSSDRKIDYSGVYHGFELQLFTYLHVLLKQKTALGFEKITPAGVGYFHLHNPLLNGAIETEKLESEWLKQFKHTGLVVDDIDVLAQLDRSLTAGVTSSVLPVNLKKDGTFGAHSSVVKADILLELTDYMEKTLQKSGQEILSGTTSISPYRLEKSTSCTFCDYKAVCQFDPRTTDNRYREISKVTRDELFIKILEERGKKDGAQ